MTKQIESACVALCTLKCRELRRRRLAVLESLAADNAGGVTAALSAASLSSSLFSSLVAATDAAGGVAGVGGAWAHIIAHERRELIVRYPTTYTPF
jgi:hypothetical protein